MVTLRIYLQDLDRAGIKKHPQKHLQEDLGLEVFKYEGIGIADCVFVLVDRLPNPHPAYLQEVPNYEFDTNFFVIGREVKHDNH